MLHALIAAALQVVAGQSEPQPRSASNDDIVVTAPTVEDQAEAFVEGLTPRPPGTTAQLPRWDRSICPLIASAVVSEEHAQAVLDRLALRARQLGLRTDAPGCRANIVIFVTHYPDELSSNLAAEYRTFVRYPPLGLRPPSRAEHAAFASGGRAVNWLYISGYLTPDGRSMWDGVGMTSEPPSRLRPLARQDFVEAVIVVDAARIAGMGAHALGDYLALISLARIDPAADPAGAETILTLFQGRPEDSPQQMTVWDESYLRGVYAAQRASRSYLLQQHQIADYVADRLSESGARERQGDH